MTDRSLRDVAVRLGLILEKPNLTTPMIHKAIKAFYEEHGKPPSQGSGDATDYFMGPEVWRNIDASLRVGSRSLPGGSSLHQEAVKIGLRFEKPDLTPPMIHKAIKAFYEEHGRYPSSKSGDATDYFSHVEKWSCVESSLRSGGRGLPGGSSLAQEALRIGLRPEDLSLDLPTIHEAMRSFYEGHGRPPSTKSGDASQYFECSRLWPSIDQALRVGNKNFPGGSSLRAESVKIGLRFEKPDLTLPIIHKAIKAFYEEHGWHPLVKSGDASYYFNYPETWCAVDSALRSGRRGLPGGSSLAQKARPRGLPKKTRKSNLTIPQVKGAILRYYKTHGYTPCYESGDATPYFGTSETWTAIQGALRDGHRGLPGGSSIAKLKREMGLKGRRPRRKS